MGEWLFYGAMWGLGFVGTVLLFMALKAIWIRVAWFCFGIKPKIYDEQTAKDVAARLSEYFMQECERLQGAAPSPEVREGMRQDVENYSVHVIQTYIANFKLLV